VSRYVQGFYLEDTEYVSDVYLISLGSCDMILGVQWLATLGPILWNFENLTMEFSLGDRKQLLQGINVAEVEWPQGQRQKVSCQVFRMFAIHVTPVNVEGSLLYTEVKE